MSVTVKNQQGDVIGTYDAIQAAIDDPSTMNGYFVDLDAGDHDVGGISISITKSLTFRGANAGTAGTADRGAESVIIGSSAARLFDLADSAITVAFDGLKLVGDTILAEGVLDQSVAFRNNVFDITATQANSIYMGYGGSYDFLFADNQVAITGYTEFMDLFEGGDITVTGNSFTGRDGEYVAGKDNDVPLIVNVSDGRGTIAGNIFTHVDIGVLVANGTGPLSITDNTFTDLHRYAGETAGGKAAGIVFFTPGPFADMITISDNQFTDADAGIRTSGVPGSTTDGSDILIDGNDFDQVASPLFQPEAVTGTLFATASTVNDVDVDVIAAAGAGTNSFTAGTDLGAGDFRYDAGTASWSVTDGEDTILLTGFESVVDSDGEAFRLVGGGGFGTVQAAVNAAGTGDTILVAPGTYDEDVNFSKSVTVLGARAGVGGDAAGRGVAEGAGETTLIGRHDVTAAGAVVIDGLRFVNDATTTGGGANEGNLHFLTGGGHELRNSVFYSTVRGALNDDRAIFFNVIGSGEVTIADNLITGAFASGFGQASWGRAIWFNGGGVDLALTGNTIDFARTGANLDMGGGSAATVEGNTFRTNGTAVSVGVTADNVTFADNNYRNVGGDLNVRNLTDGTVFDAGIAAATVTPSSALDYFEVLAGSGDDVILGTAGNDYLDGNNNPAQLAAADRDTLQGRSGDDLLFGRGGDDLLDGGAGNDALNGGAGTDTAAYAGAAAITAAGTGWSVTSTDEGTDTLTGVEIVDDAANGRTLLVGNGGFGTIQAAVDAARDGDTILVAAGTYDEDVNFNKAVTVLGARASVGGDAAGRGVAEGAGETTLIGRHDVTATGAVVIDGLRFVNDATTTGGDDAGAILGIGNGAGHQVRNSVFYSAVNGAANGVDDRAIFMSPADSGSITLADNYVTGALASGFGGGSWGRAVWFNGGGVGLVLTGNTIEYARTGVNLDMNGGSAAAVSGNSFQTNGTAVSVAITADDIIFADNDFVAVGTDFNLRALADGIVFDGELAAATVTPVAAGNLFQVLGGSGADRLSGTAGDDELNGNQSNTPNAVDADVLDGRDGDDLLLGKGGDDTLIGGGGNDTAAYAGSADGYAIGGTRDGSGFFTSFTGVTDIDLTNGDDGADTLSGVETLRFANGETVSLVGGVQLTDQDGAFVGSFATIQEAIDAAEEGYTITLAPGEYREKITIDVAGLTINGAGATLLGSLLEDYGIAKGGLYEYLTGPSASAPDTTGVGLTVAADGVTINGLGVTGWYDAALLADGTDGLTLSGVDFTSNLNGLRKGTDADVTGLVINDGSFADGYVGLLIFKTVTVGDAAVGNLSDVLISGTDFADLARKGIYAETLSDARITGISMTNVGQFGAAAGLDGPNGTFGAGSTST